MSNLDLSKEKIASLEKLEEAAIIVLLDALAPGGEVDEKAKMAQKVTNTVAKNRQTMTAREGIRFSMAATIGTEADLKRYISVTQPEVKRALAGKSS